MFLQDKLSELRAGTDTVTMGGETERSLDTDMMGLELDLDMYESEKDEEDKMNTPDLEQVSVFIALFILRIFNVSLKVLWPVDLTLSMYKHCKTAPMST